MTTYFTQDALEQIRTRAQQATDGSWSSRALPSGAVEVRAEGRFIAGLGPAGLNGSEEDAAHIAGMSPLNTLRLLDQLATTAAMLHEAQRQRDLAQDDRARAERNALALLEATTPETATGERIAQLIEARWRRDGWMFVPMVKDFFDLNARIARAVADVDTSTNSGINNRLPDADQLRHQEDLTS